MLQIEHRELLLAVVCGGQIDKCAGTALAYPMGIVGRSVLRGEVDLHYLSVGNILVSKEVLVGCGDFDTTLPTYRTIVVLGSWVVDNTAIDGQVIIVETWIHRAIGSTCPHAILILVEHSAARATKTQTHNDRLGIGSHNAETGISL